MNVPVERRVYMRTIKRSFIVLTLIFLAILGTFAWIIDDIQDARIESCQRTYSGVREVLLPFFPPPDKRTETQKDQIIKLDDTIYRLQSGCTKQTGQGG